MKDIVVMEFRIDVLKIVGTLGSVQTMMCSSMMAANAYGNGNNENENVWRLIKTQGRSCL